MTGSRVDSVKLCYVRLVLFVSKVALGIMRVLLFGPPRRLLGITPRRVLLYRVGNLGDMVVVLPTMDAIRKRFPRARIYLLTSPGRKGLPQAVDLVCAAGLADEVILYYQDEVGSASTLWSFVRKLEALRFDLFIELPTARTTTWREARNLVFARLVGCRYAVGCHVSYTQSFARVQARHWTQPHEVARIYNLVAPSINLPPFQGFRLVVPREAHGSVNRLLASAGVRDDRPLVVVHPGAKLPSHCWVPERYAQVADELQKRYGFQVVLTGTDADHPYVQMVVSKMRTQPVVLCGCTSALQLAALLERAHLYIGNDTGPMHLAATVGTPVVAIFSGADFPGRWYPYGEGHVLLRKEIECSPCFKAECDRGNACLEAIQIHEVLSAVDHVLRSRKHACDGAEPR